MGMFDDLVPQQPAPAPQGGTFDDLVPKQAAPAGDMFDDLVPKTLGDHPQGRGIIQALKDYPMHLLEGIWNTPQRAIENSAQSLGTGTYDPGPTIDAAMLGGVGPSVAGVRLPLKLAPKEGAPEVPKPVEAPAPAAGMFDDLVPKPDGKDVLRPLEPASTVPPPPADWKPAAEEPATALPPITVEEPKSGLAHAVRKILSPDTISPEAETAAGDIRQAGGRAARDTMSTEEAFRQVQNLTSKLTDAEKMDLNHYIETRSAGFAGADKLLPAEKADLQAVADTQREAVQQRKAKIEAMDSTSQAEFIQDYLPHIYEDPKAAQRAFTGTSKEGSGRFLMKRSIPTLKDAMERGIKPKTLDPLELTQQYVGTMDRFIATRQVLDKGVKDGNLKAYPPGEQPPGWMEVNTKYKGSNMPWYAPEGYARIYNNFVDRGWNKSETWGPILNGVQHTSNAITSLKLGLSGFHALTMAKEAYASGVDRAVSNLASGRPIHALGDLARAPTKFIENAIVGKHLKDVYLGKDSMFGDASPRTRQIVDLLTDAGGRLAGNRHAPDYRYSAMDSYWNTFKRGTAKAELIAAGAEARKGYGLGTVKVLAQQVGRIMQTAAKPLFEHYIPVLKNGAAYDMMSAWLDANKTADHPTQLAAARKIVDAIDDRFGEMIQDNIFWNKTMKQALQTSMTSYSWFLGTARAIGGGTAQLVRNPARLSMKHPDWKPNASYALALPFVVATSNAVYQYLKTGKSPDSIQDLMAPETGGTVAGVGSGKQVKERAQLPGYEKDVFGWLHDPKSEAYNKLSGGIKIPWELMANKDWKDQPIRHSGAPAPEQVKQVLTYILQGLNPISITKLQEGQKKGSALTNPETVGGIKNAPPYLQDPEGSSKTDKYFADKAWQKRQNWERSHARKMQ